MEEEQIGRREREAVRVAVEASPLRGLPIPPCSIQSIAVAKRDINGPLYLYLGTDNGHLLQYTISSATPVNFSGSSIPPSPSRSSRQASPSPVETHSSQTLIPSLSLPPALNPHPGSSPNQGSPSKSPVKVPAQDEHSEPSAYQPNFAKSPSNSLNGFVSSSSRRDHSPFPVLGSPVSHGISHSPFDNQSSLPSAAAIGTEMVLTKRRIIGKTPVEGLCALPECGRLAMLFDGQVCLLDMRNLGALEKLSATKGASCMARATSAPQASSSSATSGNGNDPIIATEEYEISGKRPKSGGSFVGKLGEAFGRRASQSDLSVAKLFTSLGESFGKLAVCVRKKIALYEVCTVVDKGNNKEKRANTGWDDAVTVSATKVREIASVEGIVTMAWLENVVIAGTRQEYMLFSVTSGQSSVLFSLPQDLPYPPLLKLFPKDLEVLLLIDNVGILANTEGQPTAGSLVFNTVPDAIGQTPPYVVVVKQGHVELYHRKTGAKIQSLEFTGAGKGRCLVADDDGGSYVVVASASKVWCLQQVSLDEQVRDLLKQRQFHEAVRLAEEGVTDGGGEAAKERLAIVHAEAGFLLLFDLHFEQAMHHYLQSEILQPSELFPFFPSFTSRWRNLVPRKRYWGLHPPPQPILTVIESGLLAMQSGLLVLADEANVSHLVAQGSSGKTALINHYLSSAMLSFTWYLGIVRDKNLKPGVKEGVDTLLLKLYTELLETEKLEKLVSTPNSCLLEEVETTLKAATQLRPLALLYESKDLIGSALQVWESLALTKWDDERAEVNPTTGAGEAARLLELSSDSALVLQHVGWILRLDQRLALRVLTSSKRSQPLPPGDVLTLLDDDGGTVRQRYLQWLVQEQGSEDTLYHTELALSLAKAALDTLPPSLDGFKKNTSSPQGKILQRDAKGAISREASMNHSLFRDMLQTFLVASDKYEAIEVLSLIQESKLWREQERQQMPCTNANFSCFLPLKSIYSHLLEFLSGYVLWLSDSNTYHKVILHQKLGDETAALQTLALKLEDSEAAERYCAELGRPEAYMQLLDMYLKPGEGREPMHGAAVRLLHCHGASLDPLKVLEALSPEMPLPMASQTISRMLRARVHRHRQGQIVRHLERHNNLEARVDRVEERSRQVCITTDTACARCRARIGTKLFALYPDDTVVCYKCSRLRGEHISPVTGKTL